MHSVARLVLLDEALCCRFPDLSLSGTAGWLWGENRTNTGLDVAAGMTVMIGPNMKAGWRAAGRVCGSLDVWSACLVWKLSLTNKKDNCYLWSTSLRQSIYSPHSIIFHCLCWTWTRFIYKKNCTLFIYTILV